MKQSPKRRTDPGKDREALLDLLLRKEGLDSAPSIARRPDDKPAPLSFAQERLWFLDQLNPDSPAYNIPVALRINGPLDLSVLRHCFDDLVSRHDILRTSFPIIDGQPRQLVAPFATYEIELIELHHLLRREQELEILELARELVERPFDLSHGPLLRIQLLCLDPTEHILLLTLHHMIADAWSLRLLMEELATLYSAYAAGLPAPLDELPISYADYAVWQRGQMQGKDLERQLSYWKAQLAGELPVLALPTDRPRPTTQTYRGGEQSFQLPKTFSDALRELGRRQDLTLFMVLLAAFKVLLFRYTAQDDILVGVPSANRGHSEVEKLVGLLVNTLVMRTRLNGNPTFDEFLEQVRDVALMAYEHQDVPFERLVEELHPERSLGHNPLFQVMFVFLQADEALSPWTTLSIEPMEIESTTSKFDLTLFVVEEGEALRGWLEYSTDLFEDATIKRMLGHFQTLLLGVVENPSSPLSELSILTTKERQQLLLEWNDTSVEFEPLAFHQLFEAQAERTPDKTAVICAEKALTYDELNRRANQLANHLRTLGVGPDVIVGILTEQSLEMMIGLLGILKAGGAYLPLDISLPLKRIQFMLQDAGVSLLLTQTHLATQRYTRQHKILLDGDWNAISEESDENPTAAVELHHLAYVMFTSGSTGTPKGVMIQHRGLVNYLNWAVGAYPLSEGRGVPVHSSIGFDLTITGLFAPLLVGQTVHLLPPATSGVNLLSTKLESQGGFSLVKLTPTHLSLLSEQLPGNAAASRAHSFVIGGEQLTAKHVSYWREHAPAARLFNEYGPTETVVGCCVYEIPSSGEISDTIPIGRPIANTRLYILDQDLNPVPVGVIGELFIAGAGVAKGYLNRPHLTAESFIPDPFSKDAEARLYKTGDLARYLPDGNIQYVGRIDDQVNIRGLRVELGEIEVVLSKHAGVQKSIVVLREDKPGEKRLVAYIVSREQATPSAAELRRFLKDRLPNYMVPSAYVFLEALPLTTNQKTDRQALPAPELVHTKEQSLSVAAQNGQVERRLLRIWEELLQIQPINVTDDFFELGGHSLLAVRLFTRIEEDFGINLHITSLFQGATVKQLSDLIRQPTSQKAWSSLVEIQPQGAESRLPFYCVHGITGDVFWYGDLARYVGPEQPFYGLQSRGLDGIQEPLASIEDMATHYVNEIKAFQPNGPYLLGGYSYGGNVAFEMAQQLHVQGEKVALLLVLDDVPSTSEYYRSAWRLGFVADVLRNLPFRLQDALRLSPSEFISRLRRKTRMTGKQISQALRPTASRLSDFAATDLIDSAAELPAHVRQVIELNYRAMRNYVPQLFQGQVTLLRAEEDHLFITHDSEMGWGKISTKPVVVEVIPGSHLGIFREPNIRYLADRMREYIDRAQVSS